MQEQKDYYEKNKEIVKSNAKKYYEENKHKIKKRHDRKIKLKRSDKENG